MAARLAGLNGWQYRSGNLASVLTRLNVTNYEARMAAYSKCSYRHKMPVRPRTARQHNATKLPAVKLANVAAVGYPDVISISAVGQLLTLIVTFDLIDICR
jgi:hypothetical protein